MKKSPNWVEMPDELMVDIFKRLATVELLDSVWKVCTTWRRICKYPEMWKVINMLNRYNIDSRCLVALTKKAVDLSCGELIDISIDWFATQELLDYIVLRSNKMKRLCLKSCFSITGIALTLAVKRIPQLEELQILQTCIDAQELEVIGRNCPHLKSFKMLKTFDETYDDIALAIANNMPELCHLDVCESNMTNDGLKAILNGCPHLQSLDVRWCYNLKLGGDLGKLCKKRIKDFKHGTSENLDFYYFEDSNFEFDMYDNFYESQFYQDFDECHFNEE